MEHDLKKVLGFSALDFLYWAYFGAFLGFVSTYFLSCGMSSSMLSLVMAAYMFMAFLGAFFWGGLSDKKQSNKKVFIPELIALTVLCIAEFFLVKVNIFFAAIMHPLIGFMAPPLGTNLDSWMLRSFHRDAAQFGRARALGSAGYAIMMLIGGQIYNRIGFSLIPVVTLTLFTIILILAGIMQEEPYEQITAKREKVNTKDLLKIKPYVFLIVTIFLTGIAIAPINSLKIVIIESVGGDVSILGLDSFIGVMVQAVFIFISGNLKRIPSKTRMLAATVLCMVMLVLTWQAVAPSMIIAGTVMMNISYGVLLPTMRETTEKNVPSTLKNRAHSLTDAMFGSFAGVIALLYSGTLMDMFGAKFIAFLGMLIMIVPIGLCLMDLLKKEE
ncbi:MAG: MFS transporter [Solobacterium sp.]|nr:MFS transporter [Solobacterium sp.]